MEKKFTIRTATTDDFKIIAGLNKRLFIEEAKNGHDDILDQDWPDSSEGTDYYLKVLYDPEYIVFIAQNENQESLGYLIGTGKSKYSYRIQKVGELENMYIVPKVRNQGLGSELIGHYKKWLKEQGIQRVYVSAYAKNEKAIKFYENNGFSKLDIGLETII